MAREDKQQQIEIEMGNQFQKISSQTVNSYSPPLDDYKLKHCGVNYYVWQHCLQNSSLIQFPLNIATPQGLNQQFQSFLLRHRHRLLVSNEYFRYNQSTGKASVFYERVFTNLGRIKDIPFEDGLMFYYVALRGFQILYNRFGYFQIQDNMFHITDANRVKIWCHKDISKLKPKQLNSNDQVNKKGSEQSMVKKIISIIQQNSDPSIDNFPIGETLYNHASFSFSSAIQKLKHICSQKKFVIPEKLACLQVIAKGEVADLLDQYGEFSQGPTVLQYCQQEKKVNEVNQPIKKNLEAFGIKHQNNFQIENLQQGKIISNQLNKIVTTNIPLCQLQNTRTKKQKGLVVSHSLQKLTNPSRINNAVKQPAPLGDQSPIKQLQIQQKLIHPLRPPSPSAHNNRPQAAAPLNIAHPVCIKSPNQFPPYLGSNLQIQNCQRAPAFPQHYEAPNGLIRRNSIDYRQSYSRSPDIANRCQYQIVVNYAPRPTSNICKTSSLPIAFAPIQSSPINRNTISHIRSSPPNPMAPSASRLKHMQNLKNIENAYRKTEQNLLGVNKNYNYPNSIFINTNNSGFGNLKDNKFQEFKQNPGKSQKVCSNITFQQPKQVYKCSEDKNSQFDYRSTFINKLTEVKSYNTDQNYYPKEIQEGKLNRVSSLNNFQPTAPLQDYTNFKARFENYKKSFIFDKKQTKYDPKYEKQYTAPKPQPSPFVVPQTPKLNSTPSAPQLYPTPRTTEPSPYRYVPNLPPYSPPLPTAINTNLNIDLNKLNPKPFFAGILKADTVDSYLDPNEFHCDKNSQIERAPSTQQNRSNGFPSGTDISDNTSIPAGLNIIKLQKQPQTQKWNKRPAQAWKQADTAHPGWHQQSVVISHDPNASNIKLPQTISTNSGAGSRENFTTGVNKCYAPKIDSDIWADMQRVRKTRA